MIKEAKFNFGGCDYVGKWTNTAPNVNVDAEFSQLGAAFGKKEHVRNVQRFFRVNFKILPCCTIGEEFG